ncbi:MAG TPA: aromatic ring-hydroxylating dioxygenase subunit alpha [Acidimicrobiales bacterium]|nr:aromatic ring-hydroxylating dioxygenase subunit alpha [Acidimicrobiales bacterium]
MTGQMVTPPHAVADPAFIPAARYTSPEFSALEQERLWPRVWQMACRLEEIPVVGDYAEYTICDQSILVVRAAEGAGAGAVKAYLNACRHRATQLAVGSGRFRGDIVCPFHGWRWNLDGSCSFVFAEAGFEARCVDRDDLALRECAVGTWGGCVFVNLDRGAPPLDQALAPVAALLDPLGVDRMRVRWWKSVVLNANWKMAQEAFMEGFHVPRTHPQLTLGAPERFDPDGQEYFVHPNGHSHFQNRSGRAKGPTSPAAVAATIESSRLLYEGLDAMTLDKDLFVIEGLRNSAGEEPFGAAVVRAIYEHATGAGIPLPPADPEAIARWGGVFFVFPNFFVLPQYGNALMYRSRPLGTDPESCLFELWSVTIFPDGQEPGRPALQGPFRPDDAAAWPTIPRQDFSNIERQQRGLHTQGFEHLRLSQRYEGGISNMHCELDRYLAT